MSFVNPGLSPPFLVRFWGARTLLGKRYWKDTDQVVRHYRAQNG